MLLIYIYYIIIMVISMAKKKKKSSKKTTNSDMKVIMFGLLLLLIGILGFGFGMFGSLIKKGAMFIVGEWWILILLFLIFVSVNLLFRRKLPNMFSARLVGFYILLIVLLVGSHFYFIENYPPAEIITRTIENYHKRVDTIGVSASIFTSGEESIHVGGGIVGGGLAYAFDSLFNKVGTIIVLVVLLVVGLILLFDIDIAGIFDGIKEKLFTKSDEDEEDEEEDEEEKDEKNPLVNKKELAIPVTVANNIKAENETPKEPIVTNKGIYRLPSINLLDEVPKTKQSNMNNTGKNIKELEKVLSDFGIDGKVVEVHVGPAVTQFEVAVHSGTILSKVAARDKEIAAALSAKSVAIEAPIPGKSTVGIEIPNPDISAVKIREVLGNIPEDQKKANILVALGKDLMGRVQTTDITKMPHLLVAGSTGSGKSVCMNSIIASILMRYHYDHVKLVLVDPKKVEMSHYNGLPHLLWPVVTDPKKASVALQRIVGIMDERYDIFAETGVKKIEEYNNLVEKDPSKGEKMPYIVVIIDELADLMMVASKEVEGSIQRITQLARAAGIHLIVATQRPSTNVITGIIKANIPSRISFAVASFVDSRTILDRGGAEKLLGKGDMLFMPIGVNNPIRIQGCFITDEEVERILNYVRDQQTANYDDTLEKGYDTSGASNGIGSGPGGTDDDPLYNQIVEFAYETGKISASLIQRKFRLGYNRAARIIDLLEERGVIGPQNGSKPREVLGRGEDN